MFQINLYRVIINDCPIVGGCARLRPLVVTNIYNDPLLLGFAVFLLRSEKKMSL
jgi:hypothetical protein